MVMKMLGLASTNFPLQNTIELSEEVLVQKFRSLSPQDQLSFINNVLKPENFIQALNYPLKAESFQALVQLIMSMFSHVMGLSYDQGINERFLGFLVALSYSTKFNLPKFITESMHEQLTNFDTFRSFKYQSYLMYLILDKFPHHF